MVNKHSSTFSRIVFFIALTMIGLAFPLTTSAASQSFYAVNGTARQGMLMSLTANPKAVEPATPQNAKSLVGVVAGANDAAIDQQANQISVRTDGVSSALVSTANGTIAVGDRIGLSPLAGVGSKLSGSGWIVGVAQASLTPSTKEAAKVTITASNGSKQEITVAAIPIIVKVSYYVVPGSAATGDTNASLIPQNLQAKVDKLSGKHVSPVAFILSAILVIVGMFIAAVLITSSIRNGMLAISRQPLVKSIIIRKMLQSIGLAVFVLLIVLAGVFIVLKVF